MFIKMVPNNYFIIGIRSIFKPNYILELRNINEQIYQKSQRFTAYQTMTSI